MFLLLKLLFVAGHLGFNFSIVPNFFKSLWFDLIAAVYFSLPIALLLMINPTQVTGIVLKTYTALLTVVILWLGVIDYLWFSVQQSRFSFGSLGMILDEKARFSEYLSSYPFWAFVLLVLSVVVSLIIGKSNLGWVSNWKTRLHILLVILIIGFMIRGGTRLRPFTTGDTARFVSANSLIYQSLPLYLLETVNPKKMPEPSWLISQATKTNQLVKSETSEVQPNVVLILLESFGEEYTALNHHWAPSYTPNLDALLERGQAVKPFFATGDQSVDAIPSIFQSLPNWSDKPVIGSWMSQSGPPSIFQLLKPRGYTSHFIHLSDENTMGFQSYLKSIGLDYYWSESTISEHTYATGSWGIHDEGGFHVLRSLLDTVREPYFTTFYTLSSHHPYQTPESGNPIGTHPIHNAVSYTDSCLGAFLSPIDSLANRYPNTIFILTADHSSVNALHAYRTSSGKYAIPCVVLNSERTVEKHALFNQQDLHASILYFTLNGEYFWSFGTPITQKRRQPLIHYDGQQFILITETYCLTADLQGPTALYNRLEDPNHLHNLKDELPETVTTLFEDLRLSYSENRERIYQRNYD